MTQDDKPESPKLQDINWHGRPGSAAYYQEQVDAQFNQMRSEIARCREIAERDGKDYSELKAENAKLRLEIESIKASK